MEPRHFSFNSPFGACPACGGLGTRREVSEELILGDPAGYLRRVILPGLAKQLGFDLNTPWGKLPKKVKDALLHGNEPGDARATGHKPQATGRHKADFSWEGILVSV